MPDWFGSASTVIVAVVGIVATFMTASANRRDENRRRKETALSSMTEAQPTFFSSLLVHARRVQRASRVWSETQAPSDKERFVDALDAYSMLVAQARLTEPPSVYNAALVFDNAYRRHSETLGTKIDLADNHYKLEPLVEVLRKKIEQGPGNTG